MKPKLLFLLLLLLCLPAPSFAAITAASQWEVRTTGGDSNAGVFDSTITNAGTDYSQQDTAQLTLSDVVTNSTTTVTSATGGFTAAMIGNGFNIAGTVYQITAVASLTSLTVDRATGTGTAQTGLVGGALASPGYACGQMTAGNTTWIKNGAYTVTTATARAAAGPLVSALSDLALNGYASARGDAPTGNTRPTIRESAGVNAAAMIDLSHGYGDVVRSLIIDVNQNASYGVSFNGGQGTALFCAFQGTPSGKEAVFNGHFAFGCSTQDCGIGFSNMSSTLFCTAQNSVQYYPGFENCVSSSNCVASHCSLGFRDLGGSQRDVNCVAYNCSASGFSLQSGAEDYLINSIALNCGAWGVLVTPRTHLIKFAAYNNTSGSVNTKPATNVGFINLTASPFTNPAGGDFTLNNTAGGGALLRGAGYSTLPGLTPTGYPDIGAYQHLDNGGTKRKVQ